MSNQTIYQRLVSAGLSPAGACGLMGNMNAESAMRSNNAQDGMTRLSDEDYTAGVDNGSYTNFIKDAVGYGLCQWTYWARKQNMLAFAKSRGLSIGDEVMQVDFCIKELKEEYSGLWKFLCSTDDTYSAASRVCTEYERPAVNNISVRATAAKKFFEQFSDVEVKPSYTGSVTIKDTTSAAASVGKVDTVKEVQFWLNQNYASGLVADGLYGAMTQKALTKALQRCLGVEADGIYGNKTNAAMKKACMNKGMTGKLVEVLQAFLVCNGYKTAYVDGDFGIGTEKALIAYQKEKKLEADGLAGAMTMKSLCG